MRWTLSEISGYSIHGRDGKLGRVLDTYFDDVQWTVRYLAVSGATPDTPRTFLLAPEVISSTDREFGLISVFLRTAAVHNSPAVSVNKTIPRQEESRLRAYYGWPNYWPAQSAAAQTTADPRLLSLEEIMGYRVLAGEEDIGPLIDLVIDDHTWQIHFLEVDASRWLPAGRVWIRADCIRQLRAAKKQIALNIRRELVRDGLKSGLQADWTPDGPTVALADTHAASRLPAWTPSL